MSKLIIKLNYKTLATILTLSLTLMQYFSLILKACNLQGLVVRTMALGKSGISATEDLRGFYQHSAGYISYTFFCFVVSAPGSQTNYFGSGLNSPGMSFFYKLQHKTGKIYIASCSCTHYL